MPLRFEHFLCHRFGVVSEDLEESVAEAVEEDVEQATEALHRIPVFGPDLLIEVLEIGPLESKYKFLLGNPALIA